MGMKGIARLTLFVVNFLIFACGVLLLSFGIVGIVNPTALTTMLYWIPGVRVLAVVVDIPAIVASCSMFMIVLGSITTVFGFLGCGGIVFNAKWMLFFYWVLVAILIVLEVCLIIYAARSPERIVENTQIIMLKSLQNNFQPVNVSTSNVSLPSTGIALAWVTMQFEVGCCGVYNYSDYSTFKWNNTIVLPDKKSVVAKIPPSCCTLVDDKHIPSKVDDFVNLQACLVLGDPYYNTRGCSQTAYELVTQFSLVPIGICVATIVVEVIAMAMAVYLWKMKDVPGISNNK